jgi:hypothetical protein
MLIVDLGIHRKVGDDLVISSREGDVALIYGL